MWTACSPGGASATSMRSTMPPLPSSVKWALPLTWDPLEQVDRRRAFLDDVDGNFLHAFAVALGADDELRREEIARQRAALHGAEQALAAEGLEPVRVGAVEADEHAQHAVDHERGG